MSKAEWPFVWPVAPGSRQEKSVSDPHIGDEMEDRHLGDTFAEDVNLRPMPGKGEVTDERTSDARGSDAGGGGKLLRSMRALRISRSRATSQAT
jgi:hypothetical protein